ncbi:1,4-alpha-glucan branching enzyme [Paenibacillus mucilaginosus]|uniref:alpha-amylase family glycosyl hydrolase n=1 Tax=Paenibacillus mucilaginosus TaxID=61624 RepID=UPI003D1DD4DF
MSRKKRLRRISAAMLTVPVLAAFASGAMAQKPKGPGASNGSGVFYENYVNSFYDSNGDGHGDLKGIAQKLDYLNDGRPHSGQDRGISGVWMMPINASPSYHKYDVTDYYQVDPEYGTLNDFRSLMGRREHRSDGDGLLG